MSLTVVDHPLAQHLLTRLRDVETPPPVFRTLAKRLTIALVLEAVRGLPTVDVEVQTPLEPAPGRLKERRPAEVRFVCVVAAPQGLAKMEREHPDVPVFAAALDRDLNDRGYILPGLGDFGDRLFGTGPDSGLPPLIRNAG